MVERLTRDDAFIQVVVGKAGTGQDVRARRGARGVGGVGRAGARRGGGAASGARARGGRRDPLDEPDARCSMSSGTCAREGLPRGCVVVVDEAGMVPTRALHELTQHVQRAKGKLVLVGDFRQLPEIEAGGAFGALAVRTPSDRAARQSAPATAAGSARRSSSCGPAMRRERDRRLPRARRADRRAERRPDPRDARRRLVAAPRAASR